VSILTEQEAVITLRREAASDCPQLAILLPAIDDYIKTATGKDWGAEDPVDPTAKIAATVLLVNWSVNPGSMGSIDGFMKTMVNFITQLQAKILEG